MHNGKSTTHLTIGQARVQDLDKKLLHSHMIKICKQLCDSSWDSKVKSFMTLFHSEIVRWNLKREKMLKDPDPLYLKFSTVAWVCGFLIAIFGIIFNSMTIFTIFKQRILLKQHSIVPLLFYVTVFELLDSIYGIPLQSLKFYFKEWPFSKDPKSDCRFTFTPFAIMFQMSVYLLLLITINRALSLYDQTRAARWFNCKHTTIQVFLVSSWLLMLICF